MRAIRKCTAAPSRSPTPSGAGSAADRLDQAVHPRQETSFHEADFGIKWFADGTLNLSANCLDRHLAERGDAIAILWEPDSPEDAERRITYRELHEDVCRFANLLRAKGVKRRPRHDLPADGARSGRGHAGLRAHRRDPFDRVRRLSPDALAGRIRIATAASCSPPTKGCAAARRCRSRPTSMRRSPMPRRRYRDRAAPHRGAVAMVEGRDIDWATAVAAQAAECAPEEMNAEDPLFILYTSGSTGKPKGVLHTTGGYAVWASLTHQYVFDYRPGQIYWCAADIGWVTGHSMWSMARWPMARPR
jgi:acetyl-CoA synthetase